jgi:hypothetical protein
MASMCKTYFLSPSWNIKPSEVALGSVIANFSSPGKKLSADSLLSEIDSGIYTDEETECSGTALVERRWSAGLFSTFLSVITVGGDVSYSSRSASEVKYSCQRMETKRFTPSSAYIAKVANDDAVKAHLKLGGLGTKAFIVTGIKVVEGVTITTTEDTEKHTTAKVGVDVPGANLRIGPQFTTGPVIRQTHTRTIMGPIIFAFEVERLRVTRKGHATSKQFVDGAMLTLNDGAEYSIERAIEPLDEDDLEDFGVESRPGLEDVDGAGCQIIVPGRD